MGCQQELQDVEYSGRSARLLWSSASPVEGLGGGDRVGPFRKRKKQDVLVSFEVRAVF